LAMIPDSVAKYLADNRDRHLESLKEYLRFPSVANVDGGDQDPCKLCAQWLADYLDRPSPLAPKGLGSHLYITSPADFLRNSA